MLCWTQISWEVATIYNAGMFEGKRAGTCFCLFVGFGLFIFGNGNIEKRC